VATIRWDPAQLAEVIRRRVYVASEGAFGSLDAIASPALRDVETILAGAALPLPREILVLTRRVLREHVEREGSDGKIQEEDVRIAIEWYNQYRPAIEID
jgi:predicted dinucleotide-utilizing enzyme